MSVVKRARQNGGEVAYRNVVVLVNVTFNVRQGILTGLTVKRLILDQIHLSNVEELKHLLKASVFQILVIYSIVTIRKSTAAISYNVVMARIRVARISLLHLL